MTKEVMNKRIKELAKTYLSHERFGLDGESTIEDYYEFYPEELEYFVELIVKECIYVISESREVRQTAYYYRNRLAEHFGVEK